MRSFHTHISVFISHCAEDNHAAISWDQLLTKEGFAVQQFGRALHPGEKLKVIASHIEKCKFFLLLVSDTSLKSDWVQRELGLALDLQKRNRGYSPLIIPLYTKDPKWARLSRHFPTRDFYSGEPRDNFLLCEVRGLNIHDQPSVDSPDVLICLMRPSLLVSRRDFTDAATFRETDVFTLYEEIFPPEERDSPEDIIHWVLRSDVGETRTVVLSDGTAVANNLDSRWFILMLVGRAIGFAFTTYDHASRLMYVNYLAVQECWRGGAIGRLFAQKIEEVLSEIFPEYVGTVFEIEKYDKKKIERIIAEFEHTGKFESVKDRDEIKRFERASVFQSMGCIFFFNKSANQPLIFRSPCLDPDLPVDTWESQEVDYWLMWYNRSDTPLDHTSVSGTWSKAVRTVSIEILAKSLVHEYPQVATEYWQYANAVVDRLLDGTEAQGICFGVYRDKQLWSRLSKLEMQIPI